jgi:hypothetical protein
MSSSQNARTVGGTTLRGWGDSSSLHPAIRNRMATLSGQPASSSVRGTCCWLFLQVILDQLSSSPLLTCSQGNDGVLKRCQDKGELARQLRFSANLSVSWKHDVVPCPSSMTQMTPGSENQDRLLSWVTQPWSQKDTHSRYLSDPEELLWPGEPAPKASWLLLSLPACLWIANPLCLALAGQGLPCKTGLRQVKQCWGSLGGCLLGSYSM